MRKCLAFGLAVQALGRARPFEPGQLGSSRPECEALVELGRIEDRIDVVSVDVIGAVAVNRVRDEVRRELNPSAPAQDAGTGVVVAASVAVEGSVPPESSRNGG